MDNNLPLCVDLDGTLITTDTLWESLLLLLKKNMFFALLLPFWLVRGKAYCKQQITQKTQLPIDSLPYNKSLITWLKQQKESGKSLILITGAYQSIAKQVATHLGIFSEVLATDGNNNLVGKNKRDLLNQRFNKSGYDYVGNSRQDLPVWQDARHSYVTNASQGTLRKAKQHANVQGNFAVKRNKWALIARALRVHQYAKNTLLFVPLLLTGIVINQEIFLNYLLTFISLSAFASSLYIANDLMDLTDDRKHPKKSQRPFACGALSLPFGVLLSCICFIIAISLLLFLPTITQYLLLSYVLLNLFYTHIFKKIILLDVFLLAALYTLRIILGMSLISFGYSAWLILFSIYFFISLAFMKRYIEINDMADAGANSLSGRAYKFEHKNLIAIFGIISAYVSAVIFSLYINSTKALHIYAHPQILYGTVLIILYWISRTWLLAWDKKVHHDPVLFALTDKVSYLSATAIALLILLAR